MNIERARAREKAESTLSLAEVAPGDWNAALAELGVDDVYLHARVRRGRGAARAGVGRSSCAATRPSSPASSATIPFDVVAPYGYGGPVGDAASGTNTMSGAARNGIVTTFVRFHPLYANQQRRGALRPRRAARRHGRWRLDEGDLFERHAPPPPAHRAQGRRRPGRAIASRAPGDARRLRRALTSGRWTARAPGFYYFPPEYWRALAELRRRARALRGGRTTTQARCSASRAAVAPLPPRRN